MPNDPKSAPDDENEDESEEEGEEDEPSPSEATFGALHREIGVEKKRLAHFAKTSTEPVEQRLLGEIADTVLSVLLDVVAEVGGALSQLERDATNLYERVGELEEDAAPENVLSHEEAEAFKTVLEQWSKIGDSLRTELMASGQAEQSEAIAALLRLTADRLTFVEEIRTEKAEEEPETGT